MATATVKFVATSKAPLGDMTQDAITYYGTLTFSAATDTYATGGLLPLAGFALINLGPYGNRVPLQVDVFSQAGSGFTYAWNFATGKLMILSGTAASATSGSTELTNGTALNAATPNIFTDVVGFRIVVPQSIN
jgi:hypothetical protein